MDRAGWHTTGKLKVPKNLTIILLPSRAPELDPVRKYLAVLARQLALQPRVRRLQCHRRCWMRSLEKLIAQPVDASHRSECENGPISVNVKCRWYKLMAVAGISSVIATAVIASIGDRRSRFATPGKLASYFGLTPRVRQSGPARPSTVGSPNREMQPLERCWLRPHGVPLQSHGPLRAFFLRIKDRKGANVAAVATARKIATLIWHLLTKDGPYQWSTSGICRNEDAQIRITRRSP